jgi:hypothetical protein
VGSGVFESVDKIEWTPMDVDLVFSHVVFADKFYACVDGVGIYALDEDWTLVHEFTGNFICARNIGGPAFGTDQGTILIGPEWHTVTVGEGNVWLTNSSTDFRVVLHNGDQLETFRGPVEALVSEGSSELEGLVVSGCWYDQTNKCVVVSATFADAPIFAVYKNGWEFNIAMLDAEAVDVADGAMLTSDAVYTTTNWATFVLLHKFENFVAKTLVYV